MSRRPLTMDQSRRIEALRQVARMLDSAITIPGTSLKFGLDPLLGLVPGLGDLVSPLFTIAILWQGKDLRIPKIVQLRMIINVAIDTLVGMVPILGDLFDFAWKANDRNIGLLEAHAFDGREASAGDWLFVVGMVAIALVLAAVPFVVVGWLLGAIVGYLRS